MQAGDAHNSASAPAGIRLAAGATFQQNSRSTAGATCDGPGERGLRNRQASSRSSSTIRSELETGGGASPLPISPTPMAILPRPTARGFFSIWLLCLSQLAPSSVAYRHALPPLPGAVGESSGHQPGFNRAKVNYPPLSQGASCECPGLSGSLRPVCRRLPANCR